MIGSHEQAVLGSAVGFEDHHILRHVDQTSGQITRVGGLERGIGQTLARAVGRDEVLDNVQTLAEVRGDRRLDDGAVRLGHETAHTGELTDLLGGAARAGVGHHVDGVEGVLLTLLRHPRLAVLEVR